MSNLEFQLFHIKKYQMMATGRDSPDTDRTRGKKANTGTGHVNLSQWAKFNTRFIVLRVERKIFSFNLCFFFLLFELKFLLQSIIFQPDLNLPKNVAQPRQTSFVLSETP